MVRIAVISDVHANLTALRAVLADIRGKGVDGYLCAGDLVGYGVHPNECIEVLQNLPLLSVVGNHDFVAVGAATTERCDWLARVTLEWTAERLSTHSRRYLEGLPAVASTGSITMTHGSLSDRFEYIGTPEQARRQLNELRLSQPAAQLLVLGIRIGPGPSRSATATGFGYRGDASSCRLTRATFLTLEVWGNPGSDRRMRDTCCSTW